MARRSVGYVELQWTCPNCQTKNPGTNRTCQNCGSPQPDSVEFEQANQAELIKDETKLERAKSGADIHCYYCGTRNPATAANCSQCGADLSEGARRKAGHVVGAHRKTPAKPVVCKNCSTENEPNAPICVQCGSPLVEEKPKPKPQLKPSSRTRPRSGSRAGVGFAGIAIIAVIGLCVVAFIAFMIISSQTETISGQVQSARWERTIAIEGLVPVTREAWVDEIPPEGIIGTCVARVHHTQDNPAPQFPRSVRDALRG